MFVCIPYNKNIFSGSYNVSVATANMSEEYVKLSWYSAEALLAITSQTHTGHLISYTTSCIVGFETVEYFPVIP